MLSVKDGRYVSGQAALEPRRRVSCGLMTTARVLTTESPEGGRGINGHASTGTDCVAASRGRAAEGPAHRREPA